jgi:oleate hydratase
MRTDLGDSRVYLVGGGIASLAAAVFLIRDAGLPGRSIRILEAEPRLGGALDGGRAPGGIPAYVTRGGRMLEDEAYTCLWDLLGSIPTLGDPDISVLDEVRAFNEDVPTESRARLVGENHTVLDSAEFGLDLTDKLTLLHLLTLSESAIGERRISDYFSEHFFASTFWTLWRTTFAFQSWHSAIELKRYCLRFLQELPRIHTLSGVRRTRLNQYDSIVLPTRHWLAQHGVVVEYGVKVTDVEFSTFDGTRRAERIWFKRDGEPGYIDLRPQDCAIVTLGSMTADTTYGDDDHAPELVRDRRDGSWSLWEAIARKAPDFGRPLVFCGDVDRSKWLSFTLTMREPELLRRIETFSGNAPGTSALTTFKDSAWLMSIVVPHQPHFADQDPDVRTLWGYGLSVDEPGDYVPVTMAAATGRQILAELLGQFGLRDESGAIAASTRVTTVMMPYITSQFARRRPGDRPRVVPEAAENFAFVGQFVEIPEDVVFTVEYSVRGAMHAVYELFGVDREIPPIYHALTDPKAAYHALRAIAV